MPAAVPGLVDRVLGSMSGTEVPPTTWNIFAESRHEPWIVNRLIWLTVAPLKNHNKEIRKRGSEAAETHQRFP